MARPLVLSLTCLSLLLASINVFSSYLTETASRVDDMTPTFIRVDDAAIASGDSQDVIRPVWWTANIYDGKDEYDESLSEFSRAQRLVFAVIWYDAEVSNGGHDQFYFNSTGIVWKDALEGLGEIDAGDAAAILEESARRMGGEPSYDRGQRQEYLELHGPTFDDLDSDFYAFKDNDRLERLLSLYIQRNRKSFYFEGYVMMPE